MGLQNQNKGERKDRKVQGEDRDKRLSTATGCRETYHETFSPVAKYNTMWAILAMAAAEGLKRKQFDGQTAFLNGELDEDIYTEQPEGHEDGTDRVCKLNKSLYGLKQAPRCWYVKFTDW